MEKEIVLFNFHQLPFGPQVPWLLSIVDDAVHKGLHNLRWIFWEAFNNFSASHWIVQQVFQPVHVSASRALWPIAT